MSILEDLWRVAHPTWINWFKVPRWLYWLSFRPRRCLSCMEWYWGCWYTEFCSSECAAADEQRDEDGEVRP